MSLDDIKKKKAQKPELRQAAARLPPSLSFPLLLILHLPASKSRSVSSGRFSLKAGGRDACAWKRADLCMRV